MSNSKNVVYARFKKKSIFEPMLFPRKMNSYLPSIIQQFKYYMQLGEKTMSQLSEDELLNEPAKDANSIAVIVKHLHGNMLSRWIDFLHSDGEKANRDRDGEFEPTLKTREEIMQTWQKGWNILYAAIEPLQSNQLESIVYIRNEGHTVLKAINRQLCHYSYHVGQIVYLGKLMRGENWQSLSISKNNSDGFNTAKFKKEKGRRHFTKDEMK